MTKLPSAATAHEPTMLGRHTSIDMLVESGEFLTRFGGAADILVRARILRGA